MPPIAHGKPALPSRVMPNAAASTATRPNVHDDGQRPSDRDGMAVGIRVIWDFGKPEYFCKRAGHEIAEGARAGQITPSPVVREGMRIHQFSRLRSLLCDAYRFLAQPIDIIKVVLQTTPISIRLFPGTSEAFAKPFTARWVPRRPLAGSYKARPAFAGKASQACNQ
jgi:hypothetical protein